MHVKARLTVCCRAAREALAAKQRVEAEHRRAAELAASEGKVLLSATVSRRDGGQADDKRGGVSCPYKASRVGRQALKCVITPGW